MGDQGPQQQARFIRGVFGRVDTGGSSVFWRWARFLTPQLDTHPGGARIKEYRKEIELDLNQGYTFVELGPAPEMPYWHHLAQPSRWPFPSESAAFRFAEAHKVPGRDVAVLTRDGERFVL
ncbi:hypothetical protein SEA_SMELLYB_74 [Mycobacterium phage SmellyB]|nr:hypothetical protein PBI_KAZAN_75 [Mycobacterium phage Kazan]QXO14825.1 hypothetical protein SEA_SMELLYB_74 [Mycobacterium phage SmellyB]